MADALRLKAIELSLLDKVRLLNWPFVCIVAMIALVGYGTLYSAAGGSMSPGPGGTACAPASASA